MPINPHDDEQQSEFISRCISTEINANSDMGRDQAAAICYRQWRKVKGKSGEPDKDARYETQVLDAKLMVGKSDGDAGWIEGYTVTWNNLDSDRETIRKGALKTSIKERVPGGKVKLMMRHYAHGGDLLDLIGTVTEAKEDDKGGWFHAELSAAQVAQETRQKVVEGHVGHTSIGYQPVEWKQIEWDDGDPAIEHLKMRWVETTITTRPVNEMAVITAAKELIGSGTSDEDRARLVGSGEVERMLSEVTDLSKSLEALLKVKSPQAPGVDLAALHDGIMAKRRRLELWQLELSG